MFSIKTPEIEEITVDKPEDLVIYHKGNTKFVKKETSFGIVLMGGGRKELNALRWMMKKANGGDLVILNSKDFDDELTNPESITNIFAGLGGFNSINNIVVDTREKANHEFVYKMILNAEALWIPGGNQTSYYELWNHTRLEEAVNYLVNEKKIPIGGTSAGMHSMGKLLHTPYGGNSVLSTDALLNPYLSPKEKPGSAGITFRDDFFNIPYMENIITDTHWSERNRMGRSIVFLARVIVDGFRKLNQIKLIACDEGAAVCINEDGKAQVFGSFPSHNDYAFFIKPETYPDLCTYDEPLTWKSPEGALTVNRIPGYPDGKYTFNVADWLGTGGGEQIKLNIHNGYVEDINQNRIDIQTPDKSRV